MIKQPFDWETFLASSRCLVFFPSVETFLAFQEECDTHRISAGPPHYRRRIPEWPIYNRYHDTRYVGYGFEDYAQHNYSHTYTWLEYGVPYIPNLDDLI